MRDVKKKLQDELAYFENKLLSQDLSYEDLKCIHKILESLESIENLKKYEVDDVKSTHYTKEDVPMYNYTLWVSKMHNEDGSKGGKWTMQETTEIGKNNGIDFSKISEQDWYITLNMVYSDYVMIARKYNIDNISFYIDLAKEFLWDSDTHQGKDKLERYYRYIVNH